MAVLPQYRHLCFINEEGTVCAGVIVSIYPCIKGGCSKDGSVVKLTATQRGEKIDNRPIIRLAISPGIRGVICSENRFAICLEFNSRITLRTCT